MTSERFPFLLFGLALLAALIVFGVAFARAVRARRRAKRRIVEKPNSHYTSQLAQNSVTRHHWNEIDLDRVHEINRGEVVRLLARADAGGVEALRATEREFLDQIRRIAPRQPEPEPKPREPGRSLTHLRERPA